jgi:hypothetical protein
MNCPKCDFEQQNQNLECISCGIVFEKYYRLKDSRPSSQISTVLSQKRARTPLELFKGLFFYIKPETNPILLSCRVIFFIIIFIWGLKFIFTSMETNYVAESFWHLVNLPFHEAGHIIFSLFGKFIASLGGTLGQLLIPLLCLACFLIKTRDTFAAAFCLWWFGENFMDIAPYINDARSLTLPLLGGYTGDTVPYGTHDWEYILNETGLITYDHSLAHFSYKLGILLMIISFIWGGYILFKEYKNINLEEEMKHSTYN